MNDIPVEMLALDIDGTLMDSEKRFPEINCRALQECERRGVKIALVSGRSFEPMRRFARDLGINPLMAACNGARLEGGINGPTLAEHCFERADAERVCETLEASGMYFNVYRRGKNYMGNPHIRPSLGGRYAHHVPGEFGDRDYSYEIVCDRDRLWSEGLNGVYKFVVMGAPYDERFQDIRKKLDDMRLSVSSASRRNMEFMPTGVDKGSALRTLCAKCGLSIQNVMAFGDQTNDLPMLTISGHPVAMANAEDCVRACAKYIAPDHNLGGVGLLLYEKLLR